MTRQNTFRGLWGMLASTAAGVLLFFALPRALVPYIVPPCFVVALLSLGLFYRDFLRSLRR